MLSIACVTPFDILLFNYHQHEFKTETTHSLNLSYSCWFSGHRLERDVETGGLQTKHHRRAKESERNCAERGLDSQSHHNLVVTTPTSSEMVTPTSPLGGRCSLSLTSHFIPRLPVPYQTHLFIFSSWLAKSLNKQHYFMSDFLLRTHLGRCFDTLLF